MFRGSYGIIAERTFAMRRLTLLLPIVALTAGVSLVTAQNKVKDKVGDKVKDKVKDPGKDKTPIAVPEGVPYEPFLVLGAAGLYLLMRKFKPATSH